MGIVTDSTPLEDPKDPDTCNVFALYRLLASGDDIAQMRKNYEGGNYGYGHAKTALYELLLSKFAEERERYDYYSNNLKEIDAKLAEGAEKARTVGNKVLKRTRKALGYG